jgi:6-phosphogluconolactonase
MSAGPTKPTKIDRGHLEVFPDPVAVAHAGADRFAAAARRVLGDHDRFTVALAGGSTPRAMYEILAQHFRDAIEWSRVEIYFGDERCVAPDHRDSNYRMAREALLDHVPLGADKVHRMMAELEPADAAAAYEAGLPPRLDLVLLGMGPDGHTASLFPGTPVLDEQTARCKAVYVPKLEAHRVTLTAPYINRATEVMVMTGGAEKADALQKALDGPDGVVPIQLVRPETGQLLWLVDQAAASQLRLP